MIKVNGRAVKYKKGLTIKLLLEALKYSFPMLVVKVNKKVVPKDKYSQTCIKDKDIIDVVHLISGG